MNIYVSLAKLAVESYIKDKKIISPSENLPEEFTGSEFAKLLNKKSGIFVTIEKGKQLRGCIGTYLATKENVAEEIIHNAIAAATEDYRFGSIQREELPELSYTVYILNKPKLVLEKDISDPPKIFFEKLRRAGLDPKKCGILVKTMPILEPGTDVASNSHTPPKSGLLLPDLEGVDTIEQQIFIACQKGDINLTVEKIIIYKFTVEKYVQ